MSYGLVLGSYNFPVGFHVASIEMARNVPVAKLARADGARVLTGYMEAKKITVRGGMYHSMISTGGGAPLRDQLDGLKGALAQGPASFYTDSDRYYRNVQQSTYSDTFDPTEFNRIVTIQFELLSGDPFSYSTTNSTATRTITAAGQTLVATNGGNAYAKPAISLTMGTSGGLSATITNTTTGEAFTLIGVVASGDILIIDSLAETVTKAGIDVTALFEGIFPRLAVGANTFSAAYSAGTVTNLLIGWNNRFY